SDHQVALGEEADQPLVGGPGVGGADDEDAADAEAAHEGQGVGDGLPRPQAARRRGVQPGDALELEVARQLHVLARPCLVAGSRTTPGAGRRVGDPGGKGFQGAGDRPGTRTGDKTAGPRARVTAGFGWLAVPDYTVAGLGSRLALYGLTLIVDKVKCGG